MLELKAVQTNAKARMDIKDPFLELKTTDPHVEMSSEPLTMKFHTPAAEVTIDNYPSDYSRGFRNNVDFDREKAQKGMKAIQEYTAKAAREGAIIAKSLGKGNPFIRFAKEAMNSKPVEINIASVAEPSIKVVTHEAEIEVNPGKLNIQAVYGTATGNLERGTVDITMLQYPEVHFRAMDSKVDVGV
ncbi:MAG: DUF6470 family protein [Pelosinus sp.]|nr:DUF6470 family protein [Pelosinus sp.]